MNPRLRLLAAFASAPAIVACGSLANDTSSPSVLATLHGELTSTQSVALAQGAATRVAIIWERSCMTGAFRLAEDLPVQPVFPSQFKLDLTAPPPSDAMQGATCQQGQVYAADASVGNNDVPPTPGGATPTPAPDPGANAPTPADDGGPFLGSKPPSGGSNGSMPNGSNGANGQIAVPPDFAMAFGAVVAYEDLNGNGKLDLVDNSATSYIDRILGANESLALVYVQGTLTPGTPFANLLVDGYGKLPQKGYNLFHIPTCLAASIAPLDGTDAAPALACTDLLLQWLPMQTLYTLPLTADPKFASMMCKGSGINGAGSTSSSPGSDQAVSSGNLGAGMASSAPSGPNQGDSGVAPDPSLPAPNDPGLQCAADGKSFTYQCSPMAPVHPNLCDPVVYEEVGCVATPIPAVPPPNWPCPVK
jgi:hypothetical protein